MTADVRVATVHDGADIVVLGEIDASTAGKITDAVDAHLDRGATVRIDLRDTTFCDSAGLVTLLDCRAAAANADARLVLVAPSDMIDRLLGLTGLEDAFDIDRS